MKDFIKGLFVSSEKNEIQESVVEDYFQIESLKKKWESDVIYCEKHGKLITDFKFLKNNNIPFKFKKNDEGIHIKIKNRDYKGRTWENLKHSIPFLKQEGLFIYPSKLDSNELNSSVREQIELLGNLIEQIQNMTNNLSLYFKNNEDRNWSRYIHQMNKWDFLYYDKFHTSFFKHLNYINDLEKGIIK